MAKPPAPPSSAGWKISLTVPAISFSRAFSIRAQVRSIATWLSCPHACILPLLFDLNADPHYMHNLADDPQYAETKQALSDQLMAVLREQNDPRIMEEDCRFERSPFTD